MIPGQADLDREGVVWTFTPATSSVVDWRLHVHPDLEDVAGNAVRRPFDRDLWHQEADRGSDSVVVLTSDGRRRRLTSRQRVARDDAQGWSPQ